jgi:antitoxin (DNA-binding transcriptional repressor) of toxin-antitoxin stability system
MKEMAAGVFKAECLSVMDEVQAKRETVVITKRGKPVAMLVPVEFEDGTDPIFGFMNGKGRLVGNPNDLLKPIIPESEWDTDWERFA